MSRYNPHMNNEPLFRLAALWREQSLLGGRGILTDHPVWTEALINEVIDRFVNNPDEGERTFIEKFRDQLATASSDACLLAAEVFYVMLLCPSSINVETKITNVRAVWELSGQPFPEDSEYLSADYLSGVGSAGTGYNNHRFREMTYALYVFQSILSLSLAERTELLSDGDALAQFLERVPENEQRQFRHMLLHMLFPDGYERSFGGYDRVQALVAFTGRSAKDIKALNSFEQDKIFRHLRREAHISPITTSVSCLMAMPIATWAPSGRGRASGATWQ